MPDTNDHLKRAVESLDLEADRAVNHANYLRDELARAEATVKQTRDAAAAIRKTLGE